MTRNRRVPSRPAAASIAVALATVACALLGTAPVAAHPVLVSSQPRQGARVVEPLEVVVVEFSEPVRVLEVAVITPQGEDIARGPPPEEADRNVRQAVGPPPEQGSYTLRYQVMSQDDHTVTGELTFDYAGPVAEADAEQPGPEAQTDSSAQAATDPDEPADQRSRLLRLWPLLLLAATAAAGIVVAARALRSTRTPGDDR